MYIYEEVQRKALVLTKKGYKKFGCLIICSEEVS